MMKRALLVLALLLLWSASPFAANVISRADGNWTSTGTWYAEETGAAQTSLTTTTNSTTSYVYNGTAFTCTNTHVVDAVILFVRQAGNLGTFSVALSSDGGTTATISQTVNASDLPSTANVESPVLFKFSATHTCAGGSNYKIGVKSSTANQVVIGRNATAANWTRVLRYQSAVAPAAADVTWILGEWTAAATVTSRAVTMNETATTAYGDGWIGDHASISWKDTSAANPNLTQAGVFHIRPGATVNLGTLATPIPCDSVAVWEFSSASEGQYGIDATGGTFNTYGQQCGKATWDYLNADAASSATSLTTLTSTGWKNGDEIAIAPTSQTGANYELRALNADAIGTGIVISVGLGSAKSGTSPVQAEIANLTRNVRIKGNNGTNVTYMAATGANAMTWNFNWTEFLYCGANVASKGCVGWEPTNAASTVTVQHSAFHTGHRWSVELSGGSEATTAIVNDSMFYLGNNAGSLQTVLLASQARNRATWTFTNNVLIGAAQYLVDDVGSFTTFTGNHIAGGGTAGMIFSNNSNQNQWRTFSGNVIHSNTGNGISSATNSVRLRGTSGSYNLLWRNSTAGWNQTGSSVQNDGLAYFKAWGNPTQFMVQGCIDCQFNMLEANGDTTFACTHGLWLRDNNIFSNVRINNLTSGVASGIKTTCTDDIGVLTTTGVWSKVVFSNPILASSTEITTPINGVNAANIWLENIDGDSTRTKGISKYGTLEKDTTNYESGGASWALKPTAAVTTNADLTSHAWGQIPGFIVPVDSGATVRFCVDLRVSNTYNGTAPTVWAVANGTVGIAEDTLVATWSGATNTWVQTCGNAPTTTAAGALEFYVQAAGSPTAGQINMDNPMAVPGPSLSPFQVNYWYLGWPITSFAIPVKPVRVPLQ